MSLVRNSRKQHIAGDIIMQLEVIEYLEAEIQTSGRYGVDRWGYRVDREADLKRQQEKLDELVAEEQALGDPE